MDTQLTSPSAKVAYNCLLLLSLRPKTNKHFRYSFRPVLVKLLKSRCL